MENTVTMVFRPTRKLYRNLCDILPADFDYEGYCSDEYLEWERKAFNWLLTSNYFPVGEFFDGERDSSGPLSRGICVKGPEGRQILVYG